MLKFICQLALNKCVVRDTGNIQLL